MTVPLRLHKSLAAKCISSRHFLSIASQAAGVAVLPQPLSATLAGLPVDHLLVVAAAPLRLAVRPASGMSSSCQQLATESGQVNGMSDTTRAFYPKTADSTSARGACA